MYFITKEKRGICAIGIYDNYVYGLGEKNKKLIIYQKAVLDACDWKIFYKTDIRLESLPFSCKCNSGIHAAGNIIDKKIWIIVDGKKCCRCFSYDFRTKKFIDYKKANRWQTPLFCLKCSNPSIRPNGFQDDCPRFMVTLDTTKNFKSIFSKIYILQFIVNERENTFRFTPYLNKYDWSPRFGIGENGEMIYVKKRMQGFIKSFLMETQHWETEIENVFGDWEDIVFFHHNSNLCCLTKTKNKEEDNYNICVYSVESFLPERSLNFIFQFSFFVNSDFPPFYSTKIFIAKNVVIFSTQNGLLTILNRMLSLSESAFVSLLKVPDSRKSFKIKETMLQKLMRMTKLQKKTEMKPWMSLNFIKDSLTLPNTFSLLPLSV